ncbi:cytochrome C biogenesis protein [Anaplasma phagocytophilum str. Norway variant2]|uniref:Cytochrome C biogenesis protein n=1 Tax=Anaplasma phagocytophilum str. Norway variant2 TaxID=1392507 RepID=A0A168HIG3_ANAPH|nr:thioredoxin family protein [Anaplasma phagocytophilum]ANC34634.1 cytochrome C biogenesis protein [Anaplasma phagocytophilum str. Norway variant2]
MDTTLLNALVLAFAGGVLLNFMPCVFPILSLKIISVVRQKSAGDNRILQDCVFYTVGVLATMLVLTGVLFIFRTTGNLLGWGFQLQSPLLVTLLLYVTFLLGLSFSGYYEITFGISILGRAGSQNLESFLTGVLSTLIGTPCAAPFMVSAVSFSLLQPGLHSVFIFQFMGLGMVFPYLAFSCIPGAIMLLPKPGKWMEYLKQLLAFPMYLTAAWLLHVLVSQKGIAALFPTICSIIAIAFLTWIIKNVVKSGSTLRDTAALCFTIIFVVTSAMYISKLEVAEDTPIHKGFVAFSEDSLQDLLDKGETVFVAVGAEWCLTCKTNELIINSEAIQRIFHTHGIKQMKADWTNMDSGIAQYLHSMGSSSVPFYVLYVHGKPTTEPIPQIFSEAKLTDFLLRNLTD